MKKLCTAAVLSGVATLSSVNAFSAPSAYVSKFDALDLTNRTSSTLLRDSVSPNTVWVLPPSSGKANFTNFMPSANLGFCDGLKDLIAASNLLDARRKKIAERVFELEPELEKAENDLQAARKALADLEAGEAKDVVLLEGLLVDLEVRRDGLLADLDDCLDNCDQVHALYKEVSGEIREIKNELRGLRAIVRKRDKAKRNIDIAQDIYDEVGIRYETLLTKANDLETSIMQSYANKGKLEGGNVAINYDTGWDRNVETLERAYRRYDFKAISTRNARIHANVIGAGSEESYLESLPALLDYSINGHKYVPWGETHIGDERSSLNNSIAGSFRLSTLGACPMVDKNFFSGSSFKPQLAEDGTPFYAISATYFYPVAFKYEVTASYNLYKFYEIIKKNSKRGGFFSSKSYSETLEKKIDTDAFSIDWKIEDPESEFDGAERARITAELKQSLMNRVLVTIAQPIYNGAPVRPATAGVPPRPGSLVLADGLSKECGWNVYCRAGSWILRGAQAIWGSSSSESKFRQEWNRTAKETWSAEYTSYRSGATSFVK